jgi:cob(I)alamin adenosyltransferase
MNEQRRGLVVIHTGLGKGKTTAALGTGLRAVGNGMKVLMVQFIKGAGTYGELEAVKRLYPEFQIIQGGKGLIGLSRRPPSAEDIRLAEATWDHAKKEIFYNRFDMIILDEINYAIHYGLIPVEGVLETVEAKPPGLHLILTGRYADPRITAVADIVTEMNQIRHPYKDGVPAQAGIEF